MTPAEVAIREALAAGPTDGPWHAPGLGEVMDATSRCIGCHIDVDPVDEVERPVPDHDEGERIARYVAACNPVAIRTLLSELDALRARCEAREALLAQDIHSCHPNCTRSGCVNARLTRELEEARKDAARHRAAITWALGTNGEFKAQGTMDGRYWWRGELAERAGLTWNGERWVDRQGAAMSQEK